MVETEQLTNPNNYKIFIQIKKNRRLKRRAKYLNGNYDFVEDITQAKELPDMQTAEMILQKVSRLSSNEARPRIIIKYLIPEIKNKMGDETICQEK